MKLKASFAVVLILLTTAIFAQSKLQTGVWRGVLKTSSGAGLPFNFDVTDHGASQQLAIINGAERFKVTDIKTRSDSVFIHMPLFNSEFKLKFAGYGLKGQWIKHLGNKDAIMEFTAEPNTSWRFLKNVKQPRFNISGRWAAVFGEGINEDHLVGVFEQTGAKLTGTFLSITGDYRYLEGTVAGNQLYLSCFDGGHAYLFTAKIVNPKTISGGKQFSGVSGLDKWTAVKDKNAKLPDAYSLTALKPGYKKIAFSFRDINGNRVSLADARFKNKVVIVQILGSWCPNCMDETNYFVSRYYKKFHPR